MKIIKGFAEVSKWTLTVALPLLALLNVFATSRETNNTLDFVLFCFCATFPEILVVTLLIWVTGLTLRYRHSLLSFFALPSTMLQGRLTLKRVTQYSALLVGLCITCLSFTNIESTLRARRRFYVYLFKSAYEQLSERQHLFDALTWNFSGGINSARRLLTFPERQDAGSLTTRIRAYEGLSRYVQQLATTGASFYERTDADPRLAVDYYCEVLSLSPLNVQARERLRTLLSDKVEKDNAIADLYRKARSASDSEFIGSFLRLKGYVFENAIAVKIGEAIASSATSGIAPQLKQHILSYPNEAALLSAYHQSWRIDEAQQLIERGQGYQKIASLKPKRWAALAGQLLEGDLAPYARAVMNSLTGLHSLNDNEHRLRFLSLAGSDSDAYKEAMSIFEKRVKMHPLDTSCRLSVAHLLERHATEGGDRESADEEEANGTTQDDNKEIIEILKPLGDAPAERGDEVYALRINAHSRLHEASIARSIARNWFNTAPSSYAFQLWGKHELLLSSEGRFQPIIEWLSCLASAHLSLAESDDHELEALGELLEDAAKQGDEKLPTMSPAQQADLFSILQPLLEWLFLELPSRPQIIASYIEIARKVAPDNPIFPLMAARNELLFEDGVTGRVDERASIAALKPDRFPIEIRERMREVQSRLARQTSEMRERREESAVGQAPGSQGSMKKDSSATEHAPWQDLQLYGSPRERTFEEGFELFAMPSIHSMKELW